MEAAAAAAAAAAVAVPAVAVPAVAVQAVPVPAVPVPAVAVPTVAVSAVAAAALSEAAVAVESAAAERDNKTLRKEAGSPGVRLRQAQDREATARSMAEVGNTTEYTGKLYHSENVVGEVPVKQEYSLVGVEPEPSLGEVESNCSPGEAKESKREQLRAEDMETRRTGIVTPVKGEPTATAGEAEAAAVQGLACTRAGVIPSAAVPTATVREVVTQEKLGCTPTGMIASDAEATATVKVRDAAARQQSERPRTGVIPSPDPTARAGGAAVQEGLECTRTCAIPRVEGTPTAMVAEVATQEEELGRTRTGTPNPEEEPTVTIEEAVADEELGCGQTCIATPAEGRPAAMVREFFTQGKELGLTRVGMTTIVEAAGMVGEAARQKGLERIQTGMITSEEGETTKVGDATTREEELGCTHAGATTSEEVATATVEVEETPAMVSATARRQEEERERGRKEVGRERARAGGGRGEAGREVEVGGTVGEAGEAEGGKKRRRADGERDGGSTETRLHELSVAEDAVIAATEALNVIRRELKLIRAIGATNNTTSAAQVMATQIKAADLRITELEEHLVANDQEHTDFRDRVQGRLEKLSVALEEEDRESGAQVCIRLVSDKKKSAMGCRLYHPNGGVCGVMVSIARDKCHAACKSDY